MENHATERILVVDDEEVLRHAIQLTLSTAGHEAVCADCGSSAMSIYRDTPPTLVILDYQMPEQNGIEVARLLRNTKPGVKIALCSAHINDQIILDALALGIVDFIHKPFLPQELRTTVEQICATPPDEADARTKLLHEMRNGRLNEASCHASSLSDDPEHPGEAEAWQTVIAAAQQGTAARQCHFARNNIQRLLFSQ